ncbi:DUF2000 domain-containing protein [Streptomyces sp. NPDC051105]|uniref:DUF2000 domain-containing protein n=1 Tax=Streptomyces sp. NPDC051105 TaxID=3154843 RepID=UPI0034243DFF
MSTEPTEPTPSDVRAEVRAGVRADGRAETRAEARADVRADIRFDTKIAVLLRDDLEPWQRLNVTAFLVSGLGATVPEVVGEPYEDADGVAYLPMFRQPVLVFEGTKETMKAAHERALSRALPRAVFTADLFATGNDRDNRAAVRAVPTAELDLVGLAVYGPRNGVDKVLKGARMHP